MKVFLAIACVFAAAVSATAHAQLLQAAHIGYVYPAGGQAGTTFEVVVGGKGLAKVQAIHVSGPGIEVKYLDHVTNYKRKLGEHMRYVGKQKTGKSKKAGQDKRRFGEPPEHEMFTRLEELSTRELRQVANKYARKERVQRNRELDELVILQVTIAEDARPGMRELKLLTGTGGATNPLRFMVNTLPEAREFEPNDLKSPPESHMQPPFIMNGQIMPGDEDRFSFEATEGQQLVIHAKARELVPYLADAVPGWFQAVIAVLDDKGNELVYADDFFFDPDPALLFEAPEAGTYHVLIRDSIYRGREDFVYRVSVGEIPFVTGIFPLGAKSGAKSTAFMYGWNLPASKLGLDTSKGRQRIRNVYFEKDRLVSNTVRYVVSDLPESVEKEDNDSIKKAETIKPQSVLNGRIRSPGDVDFYRFKARKGQQLKISVMARRLRSPMDSMLRVLDDDGRVLAWNDDLQDTGSMTDRAGMLTHAADSELLFTAPARGTYFIQVSDTQNQGGETHAYRLSLATPQPGFEVYITPSTITIPASAGGRATLHVRRTDGFGGAVEVSLASESGRFSISGGRIPAGQNSVPVVISRRDTPGANTPIRYMNTGMRDGWRTFPTNKRGRSGGIGFEWLDITAHATIGDEPVSRPVIPADEVTQAFITYHLVEAQGLTAFAMQGFRQQPDVRLKDAGPVQFKAGESVSMDLKPVKLPGNVSGPIFELESAPAGLTMQYSGEPGKPTLEFTAGETLEPGLKGNLVVGVYFEVSPRSKDGKRKPRKVAAGVLPAIPYSTR